VSDDAPILVVNAGSTSLKVHLVEHDERSVRLDGIGDGRARFARAVVHRVVHGGRRLREPALIDEGVIEQILEGESLAPLHNEPALRGIEQARSALPDVPQVAVFDTGFHHTIPAEAATYALPRPWRERWGIKRYGFHGLSVAWCAERVPRLLGLSPGGSHAGGLRLVVCHLGGGCSVSAVRDGRSLDTTMGFSPLEGVPMGTRAGSVDAGALVYLMREQGLGPDELEHALNFDSGLRGLAGSGDMAELEAAARRGDEDARLAIGVFCHRVAGAVAAMAVSAGGIDALAFTAGIGEHSAAVRQSVCERLAFLGLELDRNRNANARPDCEISAEGSRMRALVVAAREEIVAARAARAMLGLPL
jgi:acetate kinase